MLVKAKIDLKMLKVTRVCRLYDVDFDKVKALRNGETVEVGEASGNLMMLDNMVEEIKQAEPSVKIKEPDYGD